ncbi:MAG: ABC transporter ATP-binding protein, partial [Chloroflexota bacterium]|nr:ABC transporter ATP-binding protein [Chloroflexota bacterium]
MAHLLELADVHTFYGNIEALKGVSLTVDEGEIVTLIGSNGAGKSTTLRTISGITRARSGTVHFKGAEIQARKPHEIVGMGIAQAPEGRGVFARMSVYENLLMGAFSRKGPLGEDIERVNTLFPRLAERRSQKAGTLSGGEQQMLAMARALAVDPQVLMIDELSMGLAP